ncbi:cellulase family glycosylhydrolase [Mangrovibacterium sp.]|uniref:cellulase family glycosylhydrolase n=1 Tax=Mangrovibacterium sp. TaxID=1961364 RepID=UPI003562A786
MKIQRIIFLFIVFFCMNACGGSEDPIPKTYSLEITVLPAEGGKVEVISSSNKNSVLDFDNLTEGTSITLKATAAEGYRFIGWSGDLESTLDELSLTIQWDTQLIATFRSTEDSPVETYGNLAISNGQLVDKNNVPVQLSGMSLFWSQWMGKYWNENIVDWLTSDWKINIIRAAMGVDENNGYLTNKFIEKQKVETIVDAAISQGIYVIIDWHSHHAENYQSEAIEFFQQMATKYKDYPNVIYEIYNEPLNVSWAGVIKPYAEAVVSAIRAIDPDNIIIVGTPNWSQNVDAVIGNQIQSTNIAYAFHFYASEPSHYQNLRNKLEVAISNKIPIFVTEWGVSEASGDGSFNQQWTNDWINILNQHKLSWCNWSVADKDETSAALLPGASTNGQWSTTELSASGIFIRNLLRTNQGFSN